MTRFKVLLSLTTLLIAFFSPLPTAFCEVQPKYESKVVLAFQAERNNDFLSEPGNNPIELLRRLGRAINKDWQPSKKLLTGASIFNGNEIGGTNFLRPFMVGESSSEKKQVDELLKANSEKLAALLNDCAAASESILVKIVCDAKSLSEGISSYLQNPESAKKIQSEQKVRLETQFLPLLKAADNIIGAISVSNNGLFCRFQIHSANGLLIDPKVSHNISIEKYINPRALMYFCQTHPIENSEEAMKQLQSIPQSATIMQMVASAGLDFKTDLLESAARESIFYVNLSPDGDGGIPDIRFVAPVPSPERLRNNLPALKQLCVQSGIFANPISLDKFDMVKLSYFMFPDYAIYAGLADRFLILATSQKSLADEISFISQVSSDKESAPTVSNLKRKWRIRSADFNLQLQKLLQSPFLVNQGVPPISNLTFFEQLGDLELKTTSTPNLVEVFIDLPVVSKK